MSLTTRLSIFLRTNRAIIRFGGLFVLFFLAGQGLAAIADPYLKNLYWHFLHTRIPVVFINLLTPDYQAAAQGTKIVTAYGSLIVAKGCDAGAAIMLIGAAILAFPMPFLRKKQGLALAVGVLYTANLIRIIVMVYVYTLRPEFFYVMHLYIGQLFLIALGWLLFLVWIKPCNAPA